MTIGSDVRNGEVLQLLVDAVCSANLGAAEQAYAKGWRSLTVNRGDIACPRDLVAVDNLVLGVQQAACSAGYHGDNGAVFVSSRQWLCWSWCIRGEPVPYVVALARDVADSLNPGTWTVVADLT